MDILNYIIDNWGLIATRTGEHVAIVGVAVALAIATGVPIGVAIGVLFLGERLAPTAWAGLACIMAGVIAMTLPARGGIPLPFFRR